jgi:hypothetical protein
MIAVTARTDSVPPLQSHSKKLSGWAVFFRLRYLGELHPVGFSDPSWVLRN